MDEVEDGNPCTDVIVDITSLMDVEGLVCAVKVFTVVEFDSINTFVCCDDLDDCEKRVEVNLVRRILALVGLLVDA